MTEAEIGIFGGSGLYELLTDAHESTPDTPYGPPSDAVVVGEYAGRRVAFLPRHGRGHRLPPHRINYRANVWALRELGVQRLLAPCAVGGLHAELDPGTFVVLDQLVDRTRGRPDTFYDGPGSPGGEERVLHVPMADPYCPELRDLATSELAALARPHRSRGTIVVVQGPRFSTRAESRWFGAAGWDVVGMTQYPEVPLARELGMCVLGVAMVTDHDAGVPGAGGDPDGESVTSRAVLEVFAANVEHLRHLLAAVVGRMPPGRACNCGRALDDAQA